MLTGEDNEKLTRVSAGTPAGEMLRRYWWPVGFSELLGTKPQAVTLLGDDLVLFRDGAGRVGLLDRHCSHRRASLEHGRTEDLGLRCCYHGWLYDVQGRCLEQPAEPEDSTFKDRIRQPAYIVREVGGLVFAYLGPEPAPLLPRYDLLCREDGIRVLGADEEYCNWLQRAENGLDTAHLVSLHASVYPEMALKRPSYAWEETAYGWRNIVYVEGLKPRIAHFIFPSHSRISTTPRLGEAPSHDMRFRVPTDDSKTTSFWIRLYPTSDEAFRIETKGLRRRSRGQYERVEDGWWGIASGSQDMMAQESQGIICDRTSEHLGASDQGIILFRQLVRQAIDQVARGEDPPGIIRDPNEHRPLEFDATLPEEDYVRHA